MATHTDAHLEFILDKFEKVSKQVGLIRAAIQENQRHPLKNHGNSHFQEKILRMPLKTGLKIFGPNRCLP
jgi:hypothetical protein